MTKQCKLLLLGIVILFFLITSCRKPTAPSVPSPEIIWTTTLGGTDDDWGFSVQESSDGKYIIAGYTASFGAGYYDVYLIKTDTYGNASWTRTYGGSNGSAGYSVQEISDGGYIIAGKIDSSGLGDYSIYLIKTDAKGNASWTKTYGAGSAGCSVQKTLDGGYIIAGITSSFGSGNSDVYLIKTDEDGDALWTKTYGGSNFDMGWSIQQTSDGGYIITGYTSSFGAGGRDVYLIKTDENGDTLWTKTYGGISDDEGRSVQQTSDGGYIVAGFTISFGAGYYDVYLIKTDENGDTLWTKTYGGISDDQGRSVQQTSDGGYIVAGFTFSFGAGHYDVYLIKTDKNGDTLWAKTCGGGNWDIGNSIQITSDGGYIVTGHTNSFGSGNTDVYLIKTDGNGNASWSKTYGGFEGDWGHKVQQTSDGGYIITGYTSSFGAGGRDVYLIKTDENDDTQQKV